MIRPAAPTDIHALIDMAQAFFVETGWAEKATLDVESFAYTAALLMDGGILLVAERDGQAIGMAGAGLAPAWWNKNVLTAQELFWYVQPQHRKGAGGQLMDALEQVVTSLGVRLFSMSAEEGLRSKALGRLYRHRGYVPSETLFWKQLGAQS